MESTERLAGCAGSGEAGCGRRPDYVIKYVLNPSGLPDLGETRVFHACYRHLHRVLKVAIPSSVAKRADVSQYKGA